MGSSSSTRWNGHVRHRTERDAYAFGTAALKPMLRSLLETSGTFEFKPKGSWFCGDLVMGRVMRTDTGELTRTLTIDYDERPQWQDHIRLASVPGRFGGLVWFFCCPMCERRVRTVYVTFYGRLPQLSKPARCRQCCGLRYHVQRCSPERRADLMVMRAARRIDPRVRGNPDDFDHPPEKPKRMRWATYDRLCVLFADAAEARDEVFLAGAAAFLWRIMPKAEREHWRAVREIMAGAG